MINESRMIAVVGMNPQNRYSGGRIHALWLAYAFAANGYEVDYYTNCIPIFYNSMPDEYKSSIHFKISKFFIWESQHDTYQHIVVVPHLISKKSPFVDRFLFYPFAKRLKKHNHCKMWYLDFESPNWIQEINPDLRPISKYKYSNRIISSCDVILSTTKTGMKYAEKYYSTYNPSLIYRQLYLAINTNACENFSIDHKENQALFFARFGQKHKNNEAIFNIVRSLPERFCLCVLGNKDTAAPEFIDKLENVCRKKSITLSFYKNISDKEKFELLAKTKIVFFSSKFEGYGIPPLEAQYMGTSVICSDLPVLREVNPMATFVDFDDEEQLSREVRNLLMNPQDAGELRNKVEQIATPNVFFSNLDKIIKSL